MSFWRRPTEPVNVNYQEKCKTPVVAAQSGKQLALVGGTINNRSGSTLTLGIGFLTDNTRWKAGKWTNAGNPEYTDDTTDAQNATTDDFALFDTTNNNGFAVQSLDKFGFVGIQVTTAASGGSPVYEYTYWNGTSYTALTLFDTPTWGLGERTIGFAPPNDWTAVVSGDQANLDGFDVGKYVIRARATTASATAGGLASKLWVARLYDFKAAVATDSVLNINPEDPNRGVVLQGGEGIVPYFSTANANNSVSIRYYVKG